MIFTELRFVLFFAVVFCVHWALRGLRARKIWLLLCSYGFYAGWDWRFLSLIWVSTIVDWIAGGKIHAASDRGARRRWLTLSLVANLGLLATFKYLGFFIDSGVDFLELLGFEASRPALEIVLPVGISFYTFQTMSYSLDIYFGKLKPAPSFLDLAVFVGFFPQLVAGPIVRAADFLPLLRDNRRYLDVPVRSCLILFLVGFIKKACISDNVVSIVDPFFNNPIGYDVLAAWAGVLMYAVQIYCDFSGYSDMAIACAGLLGYQLRINFDFPYFATDIRDFWRRWHISLSSWLKDYLYIPLGGSRGGKLFTYRNLMLTMLLGGLWHGAGWNFVIWGGLHGLALVVHRETERAGLLAVLPRFLRTFGGAVFTFWWVCLAWVFFRAETFEIAMQILRSWVLLESDGPRTFGMAPIYTFAGLVVVHAIGRTHGVGRALERLPGWAFAVAYGILVPLALSFANGTVKAFIYFQF
jgi:alginate O-acetyltransferase complex protein AlgI